MLAAQRKEQLSCYQASSSSFKQYLFTLNNTVHPSFHYQPLLFYFTPIAEQSKKQERSCSAQQNKKDFFNTLEERHAYNILQHIQYCFSFTYIVVVCCKVIEETLLLPRFSLRGRATIFGCLSLLQKILKLFFLMSDVCNIIHILSPTLVLLLLYC